MTRTTPVLALALLAGCTAGAPQKAATPPPFACTSAKQAICELERGVHTHRFEQAEQNALIREAERKRKAAMLSVTPGPLS